MNDVSTFPPSPPPLQNLSFPSFPATFLITSIPSCLCNRISSTSTQLSLLSSAASHPLLPSQTLAHLLNPRPPPPLSLPVITLQNLTQKPAIFLSPDYHLVLAFIFFLQPTPLIQTPLPISPFNCPYSPLLVLGAPKELLSPLPSRCTVMKLLQLQRCSTSRDANIPPFPSFFHQVARHVPLNQEPSTDPTCATSFHFLSISSSPLVIPLASHFFPSFIHTLTFISSDCPLPPRTLPPITLTTSPSQLPGNPLLQPGPYIPACFPSLT